MRNRLNYDRQGLENRSNEKYLSKGLLIICRKRDWNAQDFNSYASELFVVCTSVSLRENPAGHLRAFTVLVMSEK